MIKSDARAREKPCLRCGYSLRNNNDATHCPECGLSVWLSLNQNDTLELSNPLWLRRMAMALWIMAAAALPALAGLVPASVQMFRDMVFQQRLHQAVMRAQEGGDPTALAAIFAQPRPRAEPATVQISLLLGGAGFAAFNAGLLLLTSDERRYPDKQRGLRILARLTAGLAAIALLLMATELIHPMPFGFPVWLTRLASAAAGAIAFAYLRQIARRMPHRTLARLCTWMTIAPLVSLGYAFIRNSDWPPDIIPLVYLPVSAGLFIWLAILIRRAAAQAARAWAAETAVTR